MIKNKQTSQNSARKDKNIISLNNILSFQYYVCTWFANVTTLYLLNKSVFSITMKDLAVIYEKISQYIDELKNERGLDINSFVPIPLTQNDKKEMFRLGRALELLYDASRGIIDKILLPPALSLEFAEYIRVFMPKTSSRFLKREAIYITTDIFALSVLGSWISYTYRFEDEYYYSFISTYNPSIVSLSKLNGMTKKVVEKVFKGEGSKTSLLVGIASALVLNLGKNLLKLDGRGIYNYVRIIRSGKKTMLASFEYLDITDIALTLMKLGVASPVYNLMTMYPSKDEIDDKRARTLRLVIESLSKAIMIYHIQYDLEELYKVLRFIFSEHTVSELSTYLGSMWNEIYDGLNKIKV